MRATFNTTFFIQRTRCNSEGKAPILCGLTVNKETIHISTKRSVLPDHWGSTTYRTTAQTKEEKVINSSGRGIELITPVLPRDAKGRASGELHLIAGAVVVALRYLHAPEDALVLRAQLSKVSESEISHPAVV